MLKFKLFLEAIDDLILHIVTSLSKRFSAKYNVDPKKIIKYTPLQKGNGEIEIYNSLPAEKTEEIFQYFVKLVEKEGYEILHIHGDANKGYSIGLGAYEPSEIDIEIGYHVTNSKNIPEIKQNGVHPGKPGKIASVNSGYGTHGINKIFFTNSIENALNWAKIFSYRRKDGPYSVVIFDLKKIDQHNIFKDTASISNSYYIYKQPIPVSAILDVKTFDDK